MKARTIHWQGGLRGHTYRESEWTKITTMVNFFKTNNRAWRENRLYPFWRVSSFEIFFYIRVRNTKIKLWRGCKFALDVRKFMSSNLIKARILSGFKLYEIDVGILQTYLFEWASERANERSGAWEQSDQCRASKWASKRVNEHSGACERSNLNGATECANREAHVPVLDVSVTYAFYPMCIVCALSLNERNGEWLKEKENQSALFIPLGFLIQNTHESRNTMKQDETTKNDKECEW